VPRVLSTGGAAVSTGLERLAGIEAGSTVLKLCVTGQQPSDTPSSATKRILASKIHICRNEHQMSLRIVAAKHESLKWPWRQLPVITRSVMLFAERRINRDLVPVFPEDEEDRRADISA
jgi:hypothetical protein